MGARGLPARLGLARGRVPPLHLMSTLGAPMSAGAPSPPSGGTLDPCPPPLAPLPPMAAPPPPLSARSALAPPQFGKTESAGSRVVLQAAPRGFDQLQPPRPSWSTEGGKNTGMTLPPLDARPAGFSHGPTSFPALEVRAREPSTPLTLRFRAALQQSSSQLEETRRILESVAVSRDRDTLRALLLDCAPLERALEALVRAKEVLAEEEKPRELCSQREQPEGAAEVEPAGGAPAGGTADGT